MAKDTQSPPPKRRPQGLIGMSLTLFSRLIAWLLTGLLLSIIIEWLGMVYWWPDELLSHAQGVLDADKAYLNDHLRLDASESKQRVSDYVEAIGLKLDDLFSQYSYPSLNEFNPWNKEFKKYHNTHTELLNKSQPYTSAALIVSQSFLVRLVVLCFALPVFLLASIVGLVDGLVERDLRRWGGGRESSNVFNLARRSIGPAFIAACVIYISLPMSINPLTIVIPFAVLQGWAVRVSAERMKKYF